MGASAGSRPRSRMAQTAMAWGLFVALVWSVHAVVVAPSAAQAPQRGEERADPEARGEVLWRRDCASCHGPGGDGTAWGPSLHDKGAAGVHLTVTTGRMPIEDLAPLQDRPAGEGPAQVTRHHRDAGEYLPGQVHALVEHARTILEGPDVPVVDVAAADVSTGGELFQSNCASCHAWSGRGGVLTNGQEANSLEQSSPTQVVEAMRTGLGTMPGFSEDAISDEEAADIAAYVEYLHHPRNEGGNPLNYLGPAAEGAVAGAIGIVGLLLLVRWIGGRSA